MTDMSENTRKRLEALRKAYAAQLPVRAGEIEIIWNSLRCGHWNKETLSELIRQVHGLAGSGATYGFGVVSEKARQLELLLDALPESYGDGRKEAIEHLLQGLKKACHAAVDAENKDFLA